MKLKQLLKVTAPKQRVHVKVFAYGSLYGSSVLDGMETVEDVLAQVYPQILEAKVTFVIALREEEADIEVTVLHIHVELFE